MNYQKYKDIIKVYEAGLIAVDEKCSEIEFDCDDIKCCNCQIENICNKHYGYIELTEEEFKELKESNPEMFL